MASVRLALCFLYLSTADAREGHVIGSVNTHQNHTLPEHGPADILVELEEKTHLVQRNDTAFELRREKYMIALQPIFKLAPKDSNGLVTTKVARYALHRLFSERHGWNINGVERRAAVRNTSKIGEALDIGGNITMLQLATFAATLETLVKAESTDRLKLVFDDLNFSRDMDYNAEDAKRAAHLYLVLWLSRQMDPIKPPSVSFAKKHIKDIYPNFQDYEDFVDHIFDTLVEDGEIGPSLTMWDASLQVINEIAERYGSWQDKDCVRMREALMTMETPGTGRVPLSRFWGGFTEGGEWNFQESAVFLKQLNALDGEGPNQSVIVPNYIYSQANCLSLSGYFDVCCINECDSLLSQVEAQVDAPAAAPQRIAEVVSTVSSRTVSAPRELPARLLKRLDEIAEHHRGLVPLHGRLFAQFMHHSYPHECPYPSLDADSVVDTETWITPQDARSYVNQSEVTLFVEAAGDAHYFDGSDADAIADDLPWMDEEELFMTSLRVYSPEEEPASQEPSMTVPFIGMLSAASALLLTLRKIFASGPGKKVAACHV
eukprot:TRINITY_DN40354_c0_g1_i1.p1 TRINITY_DN40354_c0_g1~~TRINITY_DN40354_c0_g1_i1.p1  ORF type:complete len:546 (-),score=121.37 TRINITY_DN40354_c0_g1_i1:103-1740(-)